MKSKLLTIVMVVVLVLSLSVPAFAVIADYNSDYYLELPSGDRLMSEKSLSWGKSYIYVIYESDGIRFATMGNTLYLVKSDGSYSSLSFGSNIKNYESNGKTWTATRKCFYPFTIAGVVISDITDWLTFKSGCSGSQGVFLLTSPDVDYTEAVDFFLNPLLETMKVQQGKANLIPLHLVSWVRSLMPLGISCLVLLLLVPILSKVLRIFLG